MPATRRPTASAVPLETWRDLLAAAHAFRATAPWEWMDDCDVFALVDEQGRPWFPSVLGAARQIFGVALYRNENGLRFLLEAPEILARDPGAARFSQDALLLDWGAKKALQSEDLAVLTALGHAPRPRERNAWPCFRSHAPGWHPWFLDAAEARNLARGTRALLVCAELVRRDPGFFEPNDADPAFLPTVEIERVLGGSRLLPSQVEWRHWQLAPAPGPASPPVPPDWASFRQRPQAAGATLEFDLFHLPAPVADGGRPYFPRVALVADGASGYLYAMEMAAPPRDWGELVVSVWSKALGPASKRPAIIAIRRPEWVPALTPLASALGIRLDLRDELPAIAEAAESMARFGLR